ncbi:MAG TPA: F0F1 ATP synthase subunit epsilon [Actinomycetota bacterium]|nr:F0F1 ATP synthase subunit epsilon [Actinomycetota bacterium]
MATPFETFLVTPEREVWSGQATIVIARGSEGELGIMNGHAPMLIQLAIGPLFIEPVEGERIAAAVDGGFLHVVTGEGETRVDILAEHAELRDEIDVERARRLREDAERRIAADHDAEALADLAKAVTRLDLAG